MTALHEREERNRGDDCERHRRGHGEDKQLSLPPVRLPPLAREPALELPGTYRLGEDVVEDLVAVTPATGSVDRAEDALAIQRREHRQQRLLRHGRVVRKVA